MANLRQMRIFSGLLIFVLWSLTGQTRADDQTLTFTFADWKPIVMMENGQAKGLYVEILRELVEVEMGLKLAYRHRPWKRAQFEVESGHADLLVTIPTEARRGYALISKRPVFPLYFQIYTYKDHPKLDQIRKISSIKDIIEQDLTAITNLGNGWHKENVESKGVRTIEVPQDQNIAKVLAVKRADIMIETPVSMNALIRTHELSEKLVLTDVRFGPINMHIMLSKKSPNAHLMKQLDEALDKITANGRLQQLIEPYTVL